jgi:heptosyltransferase-2
MVNGRRVIGDCSEPGIDTQMTERILVVGPSWVGDMVMSQVLYKLLRKRWPDCEIDVLAPPASLPMVARMAEVNRGIRFEMAHGELGIGKRFAFGEALKKNRYTRSIVLPNSLKSALVPFAADIPIRTAFRGEYRYYLINDMRLLSKRRLPRMIDRFAVLGTKAGNEAPEDIPLPELFVDTENQQKVIEDLNLALDKPVLALCPGAEFGNAKRWPAEHFAALTSRAMQEGFNVWILGGPADVSTAEEIAGQSGSISLAGKTSLLDVVDILGLCQQVVSNDSGLMHIAAAVGAHTTVVYGSTSPDFTPPLTEKLDIVSLGLDCSPCFKRTCPLGHKNCLNELQPDTIPLKELAQ